MPPFQRRSPPQIEEDIITPLVLASPVVAMGASRAKSPCKSELSSKSHRDVGRDRMVIRDALDALIGARQQQAMDAVSEHQNAPKGPPFKPNNELRPFNQRAKYVKYETRPGQGHYCDFSDANSENCLPPAAPVVYGEIIKLPNQWRWVRKAGPFSEPRSWNSNEGSLGAKIISWEDAVADANRKYETVQQSNTSSFTKESTIWRYKDGIEIQRSTSPKAERIRRPQAACDDLSQLHRFSSTESLIILLQNTQELREVSPIPLDFNKLRNLRTPSIHSKGSDFDCSSPLLRRSTIAQKETDQKAAKQKKILCRASLKKFEGAKTSTNERIIHWLRQVASQREEPLAQHPKGRRDLNIWTDEYRSERAMKGHGIGFDTKDVKWLDRAIKGRGMIFETGDIHGFWDRTSMDELTKSPSEPRSTEAENHCEIRHSPITDERTMNPLALNPPSPRILRDITNVRRPGYTQKRWEAAKMAGSNNRAQPKKLRIFSFPKAYIRRHWPKESRQESPKETPSATNATAALEGHDVEDSPSPLRSMRTPGSHAGFVYSPTDSQTAALNATLAKLEGRNMNSWETIAESREEDGFSSRNRLRLS